MVDFCFTNWLEKFVMIIWIFYCSSWDVELRIRSLTNSRVSDLKKTCQCSENVLSIIWKRFVTDLTMNRNWSDKDPSPNWKISVTDLNMICQSAEKDLSLVRKALPLFWKNRTFTDLKNFCQWHDRKSPSTWLCSKWVPYQESARTGRVNVSNEALVIIGRH